MTKSILVLLLGVFFFSAIEAVVSESEGGSGLSLALASSPRSLSLEAMVGKWYEVASSRQVRKTFQRDCQCLASTFTIIKQNKLHLMNECLNKTTNKIVAANGTLTQVMPESYPGAFCLEFKTENKSGASVIEAQNEEKPKRGKLEEIKEKGTKKEGEEIKKGDTKKEIEGDVKQQHKEEEETKKEDTKKTKKEDLEKAIKNKHINFLVLKNVENKALLICGSSSELIWAVSRTATLDESILRSFNDEAKRLGFQTLVKSSPCPHPTAPATH